MRSRPAQGPAQFEGSVTGMWRAPLRLKVKIVGNRPRRRRRGHRRAMGERAEGQRQSENSQRRPRAAARISSLRMRWHETSACRRASALSGNRLSFDDLDGAVSGSRLRGRVALTLGDEKNVEGEIGLDTLDLAPAFALAVGAAGHDAAEPLGAGLFERLARPHRVSGAARRPSGRRRIASGQRRVQRRRPVADLRRDQGRHRRRRGERQYRRQADRQRHCLECPGSTQPASKALRCAIAGCRCRQAGLRCR